MNIVQPQIEDFLLQLTPKRDRVLAEMESLGEAREFPIVGPLVGRFLYALTRATRARRVLEMGSGFGYSAYWFALALGPGGQVILTEDSAENAELARRFLRRGGLLSRARIEIGDALQILDRLPGTFDLVFIDVEKAAYPRALRKVLPRVKVGGLIVTDNALWSGRFLEGDREDSTRGVLGYLKDSYRSRRLWTTVIPLRDGVALSLRLS